MIFFFFLILPVRSVHFEILYVDIKPNRPIAEEKFSVKFVLKNNAGINALNVNVTVTTTPKLELVSENSQIHLDQWNAGGIFEVTYDFVAHMAGDYIIKVNIESKNLGNFKGGQLVEVYSKPLIFLADWGWLLILGAIALLLIIIWKR